MSKLIHKTQILNQINSLIDYEDAINFMEEKANNLKEGIEEESLLWILQHKDIYTVGRGEMLFYDSNQESEKDKKNFKGKTEEGKSKTEEEQNRNINNDNQGRKLIQGIPVLQVDRGGKYTYHGEGQVVVYIISNLKKLHNNNPDIRVYVKNMEKMIINILSEFGVKGYQIEDKTGIWINKTDYKKEQDSNSNNENNIAVSKKIASIGVRVSKWVTTHGFALNISTDLKKFNNIFPCGLEPSKMCNLEDLIISDDIDKQEKEKQLTEIYKKLPEIIKNAYYEFYKANIKQTQN